MRKYTTGFAVIALLLAGASSIQATTEYADLILIEVSTADPEGSSNEYIEIYNPNDDSMALDGIRLQYKSANGSNWTSKATLDGYEIPARGRLLASTYIEDAIGMSSGLAGLSGHIRIYDKDAEREHDKLGWGQASDPELLASLVADKAESLKRFVDEDGYFQDSDENLADWFVSASPSPQYDKLPFKDSDGDDDGDLEEVVIDDTEDETEADGLDIELDEAVNPVEPKVVYPMVYITELFIDPEMPLLDKEDEFIELHNASSKQIDVAGYQIYVGSTFSRSFTLPSLVIKPGGYAVVYSADSRLALSNAAGAARIVDPYGEVLYETPSYQKAKPGISWSIGSDGKWGWADSPTPGEKTGEVALRANAVKPKSKKTVSPKKSVSISGKARVKGAVVEADSGGDDKQESQRDVYDEPEAEDPANKTLLAGMGGLTVLYAGYEYRRDVTSRIHQFRRYLSSRRKVRRDS